MNRLQVQRAFSIVELIIVIAVIGILAATALVAYPMIQSNAKDAKIREGASKIAGAVEEWTIRSGLKANDIEWGNGSSGSVVIDTSGNASCNGNNTLASYSWASSGKHACTLEDVLVQSGYLASGYMGELPQNSFTKQPDETFRIVRCFYQPKSFALLYALNSPTSEENTEYTRVTDTCKISGEEKSARGMNGAKMIRIDE